MPRYAYRCVECLNQFTAFHGFRSETPHCGVCGSSLCERIPSVGFSVSGTTTSQEVKKDKPGEKVKEFIEESREELSRQKQEMGDKR